MNSPEACLSDQYCVFRVGGADFAVSAAVVREVSDLVPAVGVPQSSAVLHGLCHHRNEFLPVLSLPALLGEPANDADFQFLLVMESSDGPWGLLVTRAIALESLEMAAIGDANREAPLSIVMGTASFRDGVVRVLDADHLYQTAADVLSETWAAREFRDAEYDIPAVLNPLATC